MDDSTVSGTDQDDAILAAARTVGLVIAPGDVGAVAAHLAILRGFAARVGDPVAEPAPVFRA